MRDETLCVVPPDVSQDGFASLTVPTFRASTIVFPDAESYASRLSRGDDGYTYGLYGTPTSRTLEKQIAALEKAAAAAPGLVDARYHFGVALIETGDAARGRDELL